MKILDLFNDERIVAANLHGKIVDLSLEIDEKDKDKVKPVYFDSEEGKSIFWHSSAHLLAHAVKLLFPSVKLGIGPAIEDGFYYDFYKEPPFSQEDFSLIEKKMKELVDLDLPIEHLYLSREEAIEYFKEKNEDFKLEILEEIPDEKISVYKQGDFIDLCLGPHLPRTGMIKAFKLLSVAGAYWKGDERNPMLSRIYGVSFPTEKELKDHLDFLEEAKKRDHRKLGASLEIFSFFEEAGSGLVYWLPKGAILRRIIENYWIEKHLEKGYQLVYTPHIAREALWNISGHTKYYKENMYFISGENENYVLKPMNCPGHILIYKSKVRSYKDLPLRICELGTVYRQERSGVLYGTLRVRGFTQDDAHIFVTPETVEDEIVNILKFSLEILKDFGFQEFSFELSLRSQSEKEKYMGNEKEWEMAEKSLINALRRLDLDYKEAYGEATFYGPKIDLKLQGFLKKEQATTIQFDFNLPKRFHVTYMGKDGLRHETVIIHRTILGSLERFIGILIEYYGGAFPVWLSPIQIVIMTITEKEIPYAQRICEKLRSEKFRVESDFRSEKINYKIAESERMKIPYMIIIGKKEVEENCVSVRKRREGDLGKMNLDSLVKMVKEDIEKRR
jgi:threonyl-tRNA synthetase